MSHWSTWDWLGVTVFVVTISTILLNGAEKRHDEKIQMLRQIARLLEERLPR